MTSDLDPKSERFLFMVDDSDDDVFILLRAFRAAGISNSIDCASNGAQAINYLRALLKTSTGASDLPALPLPDGHEVLAWIRSQPALSQLPVYMFTSSEAEPDQTLSTRLGASDYWIKPFSYSGYCSVAAKIKGLLQTSALPA